jgi:hypothetical protein
MAKQAYAVILHSGVPPEFLSLMDGGHLQEAKGLTYLLCNRIENIGNFVVADVLNDKNSSWMVHIPVGYIVAIADLSEPNSAPGFLSAAR